MRPVQRDYLRRFLPAMLAYAVVLIAAMFALRHVEATLLRALIALTPLLPIALAAGAMLRFLRDSDELERRVELEAMALAALLLTTGSLALGLLVSAGLLEVDVGQVLLWIMPAYLFLYGICATFMARRYR